MSNFHNAYGSGLYPTVQETVPYEASIYDLYKKVLEAHEKLLALLRVDTTVSAIRLATGLVPEVEDICSRLRIWGEQTCAVLPPRARRSLDKQLCEDDLTKKIILRSLERLYNHIMRATGQSYASTTGVNGEDEEHSSSSDENDTGQERLQTAWETRLRKILSKVLEHIRSLYRVSVLLRRHRTSSKFLSSENLMHASHNDPESTLDYAHVSEKIQQWRQLATQLATSGDEGYVIKEEEIQPRTGNENRGIADIKFFCQRLAWANNLRRRRLDYRVDSQSVPESHADVVGRSRPLDDQLLSTMGAPLVVKSAFGDNNELEQWQTVYAQQNAARVPDVPQRSKTHPDFECPYCHTTLDSQPMQRPEIWKEHVFQDLQPYVCSFEKCPDPGRLFTTRHDWIYHEQQMHRRKWTCPNGCEKDFQTKTEMTQHLLIEHSDIINERQVSTYADMCEQEIGDTVLDTCLICCERMSLPILQSHLATHMEDIALTVLPSAQDDVRRHKLRREARRPQEDHPIRSEFKEMYHVLDHPALVQIIDTDKGMTSGRPSEGDHARSRVGLPIDRRRTKQARHDVGRNRKAALEQMRINEEAPRLLLEQRLRNMNLQRDEDARARADNARAYDKKPEDLKKPFDSKLSEAERQEKVYRKNIENTYNQRSREQSELMKRHKLDMDQLHRASAARSAQEKAELVLQLEDRVNSQLAHNQASADAKVSSLHAELQRLIVARASREHDIDRPDSTGHDSTAHDSKLGSHSGTHSDGPSCIPPPPPPPKLLRVPPPAKHWLG